MTNIYVHQDLNEMHLYPCAYSMTFNVTGNKLNAILNQRSNDMLVANAWNVCQYAVRLSSATRPATASQPKDSPSATLASKYLSWGAGPRASQYLVMGAKTHAAMQGKYSPDIEDVQAVATEVLRHRIVRNYYAEAENISTEEIIQQLLSMNE